MNAAPSPRPPLPARRAPRNCSLGGLLLGACVVATSLAVSCTYDFDAAFSETPTAGPGAGGSAGGSSTGATGGGGAAPGGESPTGGSGGQAGESCTNGTDDDADTLVDCEDPDCGSFACSAAPPVNWTGPIAFALVPGADPLPDCASVWPTSSSAHDQLVAAEATCAACTCGTPEVPCSLPQTRFFLNSGCGYTTGSVYPSAPDTCTAVNLGNDIQSLEGRPVNVSGTPTCPPGGGELVPSDPTWSVHARLCTDAPFGAGCAEGSVCAPGPNVSFAVCITRAGDEVCPPGYPDKTLLHSSFAEGRSCSACTCGPAGNAQCTGETEVWFGSSDCSGAADFTVPNDGDTCVTTGPITATGALMYHPTGTADPCTPGTATASGTVTPTEPITVCCL